MQERVYDATTEFLENNPVRRHLSLGRWLTCSMCMMQQRGWLLFMWSAELPRATLWASDGQEPDDVSCGPVGACLFCDHCAPTHKQAKLLQQHLCSRLGTPVRATITASARQAAKNGSGGRPWLTRHYRHELTEIIKR